MKVASTLNITPEELGKLIINALEQHYGVGNIKSIDFKVAAESRGYGRGEHDVTVFKGADVKIHVNIPDSPIIAQRTSSLASQIDSVEKHCKGPYT